MFDRIISDETASGSRPMIRGTRVSVAVILDRVASGATRAEILRRYPLLDQDDVTEALDFAASNVAIRIRPMPV